MGHQQADRRLGIMSSPLMGSAVAFALLYMGTGMMPSMWPSSIKLVDTDGRVDPKKRALISAVCAVIVYMLMKYVA
jgi:hypothetical protein